MDLQLSSDCKYLYCLDSTNFLGNAGGDPSTIARNTECGMGLRFIDVDTLNFDIAKAKRMRFSLPDAPKPRPSNLSSAGGMSNQTKSPSVLATGGLQLIGSTAPQQIKPQR